MKDTDLKRIEGHLKRTFNTGGIIVKARPKQNDSAEVYVGDEFIGVVFEEAEGEKCQRCWKILPDVGSHDHPATCARCDEVLDAA